MLSLAVVVSIIAVEGSLAPQSSSSILQGAPESSSPTQAVSAQDERRAEEHAADERQLVRYTGALFWATFGLMIATAGLWWMAIRQARDTKESLAIATRSAEAAKASADIAKQSFTDLERPYVFVNAISGLRDPSDKILRPHILFNVANVGRSPAFIRELMVQLFATDNPTPPVLRDLCFSDRSIQKMGDIIPGDGKIENQICQMRDDVVAKCDYIRNRDSYLIFKVLITYTDIFNLHHHSEAYWLYHADRDYFSSYTSINSFN
ncbi:MAG TPA: hypothetical protein VMF12_04250 [Xanthobacteraceae bacterium]|nr:hypothetical protein [Xanthobacteraceae bacterium]